MPICKNCHSRIDKFNKDRCPICGVENPFEGVSSETIEITTNVDIDTKDYHPRKKKTLLLYFIFLGFFGVPYYYMYQKKLGIYLAIINLLGIGLIGFFLGFYAQLNYGVAYAIGVSALLVLNSALGIYYYFAKNLKDGRGEFIL